ncbi:MAG: DUF2520 domain-containing protein [Betaproteobacteria bacterium]|nr:DUF2520 domain-containing protein [Betaproteobacteria bacterium]
MKTLNIIGSGRVGRACGRLWSQARVLAIQDVLTRSRDSAAAGAAFIGAGRPVASLREMRPADVWMIATRDDAIVASCTMLAQSGMLAAGNIVFHVSGARPSSDLAPAGKSGALIASVHPIKTFTDAESAVRSFAGTFCSAEGDPGALAVLRPAFEEIGARVFDIATGLKSIYHAGGVFACNYLVALIEAAVRAHEQAGIARADSLQALEPMVRETVDAIFAQGPARALTGPIARGDVETVKRQLAAVDAWDAGAGAIYRSLGLVAVDVAQAAGLDAARADELRSALEK